MGIIRESVKTVYYDSYGGAHLSREDAIKQSISSDLSKLPTSMYDNSYVGRSYILDRSKEIYEILKKYYGD